MPLYPTSFFLPPAGVPFILEDKYMRGSYRSLPTVADRDAIATAARKTGMLVRCMDTDTIWELLGGTTNTSWVAFDPTKYIKLGAPLILNSGSISIDLSGQFAVDGNGKLIIDMTDLLGPSLVTELSAVAGDDGKVLYYDHATTSFKLKTVSSGSSYTATAPIKVTGTVLSLDIQEFLETSLVSYLAAVAADDGKALVYDHATTKFMLKTVSSTVSATAPIKVTANNVSLDIQDLLETSLVSYLAAVAADDSKALVYDHATTKFMLKAVASSASRVNATNSPGATAAAASKDFTFATGKTAMILALSVNVPDVTVTCHSTAARNDANPYSFKSATGALTDTGISVLEDASLQYNRRYAFVANLETPTVGTNTYWRVTNNAATSQTITVNITYITIE